MHTQWHRKLQKLEYLTCQIHWNSLNHIKPLKVIKTQIQYFKGNVHTPWYYCSLTQETFHTLHWNESKYVLPHTHRAGWVVGGGGGGVGGGEKDHISPESMTVLLTLTLCICTATNVCCPTNLYTLLYTNGIPWICTAWFNTNTFGIGWLTTRSHSLSKEDNFMLFGHTVNKTNPEL